MIFFTMLGGIGLTMIVCAMLIFIRCLKKQFGPAIIESFVQLFSQSLDQFTRRVLIIFMQVLGVGNALYIALFMIQQQPISWHLLMAFNVPFIVFSLTTYTMIKSFPHALSSILCQPPYALNRILKPLIFAGFFQTFSFFGAFATGLFFCLVWFDIFGLLSAAFALLVVSFYYRCAGGAYRATALNHPNQHQERSVLTHPADILIKSGHIIASIGGFYLDIFGSWFIALAACFIYIQGIVETQTLVDFLRFPEVQWVLAVVISTAISMLFSMGFVWLRRRSSNLFLETGYVMIGISFALMCGFSSQINGLPFLLLAMGGALLGMLAIAFFTNYLTSFYHPPIQFICKQAQHGAAHVLISSFFNGLVGNAAFILLLMVVFFQIYSALEVIGILMVVVYALSIAVIGCSIHVFSIFASQVVDIVEYEDNPMNQSIVSRLKKLVHSSIAIGNSYSSASGLLSSSAVLISALSLSRFLDSISLSDIVFGIGLGIVCMIVFYAISISGTYRALLATHQEVKRQLSDIVQIEVENKSHPNMFKLSDAHSLNALKTITLPGVWMLLALCITYIAMPINGFYGVLMGIFIMVCHQSFFWSLFSDSVEVAVDRMKSGRFGGQNTSAFSGLNQAYLYVHYFQWVLGPSGVIIMKFVAMIALLSMFI